VGKPGPKGKPPSLKVVAGTDRPDRRREKLTETVAGEPAKPGWLKGRAAKAWAEKTAIYKARGQSVVGCEAALAQYCALEAALIEQFAKKITPPTSQFTAHRAYAGEFFDTPASQFGLQKPGKQGKFASNLHRPEPPAGGGNA